MSGGARESRKVTAEDIQMVQHLIEQCLAHYMTKEQVIDILFQQQNIEHGFTELVWQRLEEQNQEFFKTYRLRLVLTKQIMDFNTLLYRQAALMNRVDPNRVAFQPMSNGSHIPASELPVPNGSDIPSSMHYSSSCFTSENISTIMRTENMQQADQTVLPIGFHNHGPSINSEMPHALDMTTQARRLDIPLNMMWAQNSNVGMVQGMSGVAVKAEPSHLGDSSFANQAGGNITEVHPRIDIASNSSYRSMDPNLHYLNGTLLNDTCSFDGLRNLSQSQNIGRPDTTADFNSPDIQRFYMSSFPSLDRINILDHHGSRIDNQGENRRLYDTSGNLNTQNFGRQS